MSKKTRQPPYENRHHLLFQGRHWASGRARALRNAFVYDLCYALNCNLFVNYVVMGLANTRKGVIIIVPLIRRIII